MLIHAASRPHGDTHADAHHWTIDTDDYDTGMTEIRMAVPEGWDLLWVRVER